MKTIVSRVDIGISASAEFGIDHWTEVCERFRIQLEFLLRIMNLTLIWNTISDLLLEKVTKNQRWVRRDPCIIK